jgi:integrating conjugative element protein (TIGR03749 family)
MKSKLTAAVRGVCALLLIATVAIKAISPAQAVEILRWQRLPLPVSLIVGEERTVFIERNVRVGVPPNASSLRVQSAGGAIYLRASQPLSATRLQVQDVETGALILLDITATAATGGNSPPLEPVRIVYGNDPAQTDEASLASSEAQAGSPLAVLLTRYAAQNLYAPLRTVEPVAGITRVNIGANLNLALGTLMPSQPVKAQALASWRLADEWVTAVKITHTAGGWLELDPRLLQGDFLTATFQHLSIGPAGEAVDTTVAYIVTRGHGLAESLLPRVSAIDTTDNLPQSQTGGPP